MDILDAAKTGKSGFEIMDESFDFSGIPFNYVAMIVFESKVNAKASDGSEIKIGDRFRVVSDKAPAVDNFGNIVLSGAHIDCIDKVFFTKNGKPLQGDLLNKCARVAEVHLRYSE